MSPRSFSRPASRACWALSSPRLRAAATSRLCTRVTSAAAASPGTDPEPPVVEHEVVADVSPPSSSVTICWIVRRDAGRDGRLPGGAVERVDPFGGEKPDHPARRVSGCPSVPRPHWLLCAVMTPIRWPGGPVSRRRLRGPPSSCCRPAARRVGGDGDKDKGPPPRRRRPRPTTASSTTTSTVLLTKEALVLSADGLGSALKFHTDNAARTINLLRQALGEPEKNQPLPAGTTCGATRRLQWANLQVLVNEVGAVLRGRQARLRRLVPRRRRRQRRST